MVDAHITSRPTIMIPLAGGEGGIFCPLPIIKIFYLDKLLSLYFQIYFIMIIIMFFFL